MLKKSIILLFLLLTFVSAVSAQRPRPSQRGTATRSSASKANSQSSNAITVSVNGVSFKMIKVQGGMFTMGAIELPGELSDYDKHMIHAAMTGDDNEYSPETFNLDKPAHSVTLSDYYIGETEVTQELWQAVMGSNPSRYAPEKTVVSRCDYDSFVADAKRLNAKKAGTVRIPTRAEWDATMVTMSGSLKCPVDDVSWDDCQEFIKKLNQLTGRKFRLPTEAEWEFAARGGTKSHGYIYAGSNDLDNVAWYGCLDRELNCGTHPVKAKKANELGIYDMSGNVSEWCQDWFDKYNGESQTNPLGPSTAPTNLILPYAKRKTDDSWTYKSNYNSNRVARGGNHWQNSGCRVWDRYPSRPDNSQSFFGLRLAL